MIIKNLSSVYWLECFGEKAKEMEFYSTVFWKSSVTSKPSRPQEDSTPLALLRAEQETPYTQEEKALRPRRQHFRFKGPKGIHADC